MHFALRLYGSCVVVVFRSDCPESAELLREVRARSEAPSPFLLLNIKDWGMSWHEAGVNWHLRSRVPFTVKIEQQTRMQRVRAHPSIPVPPPVPVPLLVRAHPAVLVPPPVPVDPFVRAPFGSSDHFQRLLQLLRPQLH